MTDEKGKKEKLCPVTQWSKIYTLQNWHNRKQKKKKKRRNFTDKNVSVFHSTFYIFKQTKNKKKTAHYKKKLIFFFLQLLCKFNEMTHTETDWGDRSNNQKNTDNDCNWQHNGATTPPPPPHLTTVLLIVLAIENGNW